MQADALDVLQGRGGGGVSEGVMEGRDAHVGLAGERADVEVARVVGVDAPQHAGDLTVAVGLRDQEPEHVALLADQHAVDDLSHDLGAENAAVGRRRQRLGEAHRRIHDVGIAGRADVGRRLHGRRVADLEQELAHEDGIDADREAEQRTLRRGRRLALERHGHRQDEQVLGVVDELPVAEPHALVPLGDDHDARGIDDGVPGRRGDGAHVLDARQRRW